MTQLRPFRYFKTPPEIIRLAAILCMRFLLSLRSVEDLRHERGVEISREIVRCRGTGAAGSLLQKSAKASLVAEGRTTVARRLDEVFVKSTGTWEAFVRMLKQDYSR